MVKMTYFHHFFQTIVGVPATNIHKEGYKGEQEFSFLNYGKDFHSLPVHIKILELSIPVPIPVKKSPPQSFFKTTL